MNNRAYRRPMFRKGGSADSAGTGITSGLAPRQGYKDPGTVQQDDLSKVDIRNMNMQQLKDLSERMAYKAPPMQSDNSLNNFLINFGLDIASRPSAGPGFGGLLTTAAQSAKDPFKNYLTSKQAYNKGSNDRAINKYNSESDMFKTLIEAQAKTKGSEASGKTYNSIVIAEKLAEIIPKMSDIQSRIDAGTNTPEDITQMEILRAQRNNLSKSDVTTDAIIKMYTESNPTALGDKMELLTLNDQKLDKENRKYTGPNDPQILKDAVAAIRKMFESFSYASGGRAGYANGEMVEEQVTETMDVGPMGQPDQADNPISYDQLRARLPQEISDDIVQLMSNSAEALEDFAMISTQQDVDQFNKKFSVNLVLPAEA